MQNKEEPKIVNSNGQESFTAITFWPDLKLFKMRCLENDIASLFIKRAYDLAGITNANVGITLNGNKISIRNFN
jgi:DNA topoisomerase II